MNNENQSSSRNFQELIRPQFHFSPQKYWMNDPSGLVFFKGEYHLFYQHNPLENKWGHMSWGHAVSRDLLHWQHLLVALQEENEMMIFSGCAVVDCQNSSGFGNGTIPLIAIYTGYNTANDNQSQCLAYSLDKGRSWTKYENNPVLDIKSTGFRDPKVFWHEQSSKWIMLVALSDERKIYFYVSQNLKEWTFLSEFGPLGAVDGVWECPDLFPLLVDDDANSVVWLLKVDIPSGARYGGSGGQYFLGEFYGQKFIPDTSFLNNGIQWLDYGKDFYAAASWQDIPKTDNRRIIVGWLSNWQYAEKLPTKLWKNIISIPRELKLATVSGKIKLIQKPVAELRTLRVAHYHLNNFYLKGTKNLSQDLIGSINAAELKVVFQIEETSADEFGLKLMENDIPIAIIGYNQSKKHLFIQRYESEKTDIQSEFSGYHFENMDVSNNQISIHLFIDSCSLELFGNDGEAVLTDLFFPATDKLQLNIYSKNGNIQIEYFDYWQLKSIWQ
jgi:fructan beta-fructosidase